jgi:hypothetical protein
MSDEVGRRSFAAAFSKEIFSSLGSRMEVGIDFFISLNAVI